ncbi:ABC transporter ATP-binding protein [Christensenella tenuis]|uniref:ABC transporter ATP-binding protein n=1 Tax=Christensenella tenuis TaxID=2763033 RepID=A0ABR7EF65_9FIRM|nr:ABC transporter ATP-binding protein [Christensenella tenuis]MBC5648405.1 ABC transporter ATP-binding protein [Christensenella tenuis]
MDSIIFKNISKEYGDFALRDVSFSVPRGSIMGLIGENGAGKTTAIRLLLNMIRADSGTIEVFGLDHAENEREIKEQIGVVMEEDCFYESLKCKDVAAILRHIFKTWDDALFRSFVKNFGLPENKRLKEFSRGMKMKLSIAAALSHRPRLLVLDEATSGLDPIVRSEILDVFLDFIQDEEHSILISSHITSDLEKVADYITFLHGGRVVLSENKDKMLYEYGILKCGAGDFAKIDAADIVRYRKSAFGYEALTADKNAAARKYPDITLDSAGLEDVMLLMIKGETK